MPRVKIDYVISFSSEDSENPASSLLAGEISRRKWLGEKGQASHSVVLQLAKSAKINTVSIGSHHAALVEVLVGRSERPTEPFKVLVLSSVFMTPSESKKSEAVSKVRTFQYEQLAADTRDQSWDRIRVVCLQPYNKHVKFGLSFIHIFEPEGASCKKRSPSPLAAAGATLSALPSSQRFQISANSSDEEDTFKPGELFAKMSNSPKMSVDAQIRQASKPSALKNPTESPARLFRTQLATQTAKRADSGATDDQDRASRDKDSLLYKDEERPNDKIDKIMQRDREEKEKKDRERSSDRKSKEDRKQTQKDNGHNEVRSNDRKRNNNDNHNRKNDDSRNRQKDDTYNRRNDDKHSRKNHDTSSNSRKDSHDHGDRKNDDTGDRAVTPKHKDRERKDGGSTSKVNSHARDRNAHSSKDERRDREKNDESLRNSHKRRHSPDKDRHPGKKLKAGPRSTSPHRLMSRVVFVLSGYQNPRRGTLRDKALAMGARYRPDWGDGCTHLICAFDNTPKLRQVRSSDDQAVIVKGDWIDDCCSEQRLLPWQWYATEPEHRLSRPADEESEEEAGPLPSAVKVDSECDTDDEIQKVLDQQNSKSPKRESPSRAQESKESKLNSSEESVTFIRDERFVGRVSVSDSETDSYTDEESAPKRENVEIDTSKSLPDFFDGFTFSVDPDVEKVGLECELLKRYITAYSGEIVEHITEDSVINYIVSVNPDCVQRKTVKSAAIVSPEWVWKCHERLRKVSSKDYVVK